MKSHIAVCLALLAKVYRTGESWYEDPGARHQVTRNASKDKPASLLAVFVLDEGEQKLVLPAAQ
jgi:quercetin dioxygenase-like cupin family protein